MENSTGSSEDKPTLEELDKAIDDEITMWKLLNLGDPSERTKPSLHNLASGAEATRQLLIEKGICTHEEFQIRQRKIVLSTWGEVRKQIMTRMGPPMGS